MINNTAKIWS